MQLSLRKAFRLFLASVLLPMIVVGQQSVSAGSRAVERRHQEVRSRTHQLISRLNSLYRNADLDAALDLAKQALGKERLNYYERYVLWRWIGDLYYWKGDLEGWTNAYDEAILLAEKLEPKSLQYSLLFDLSQVNFRQGKYNDAALYMKKWRKRSHIIWPPHYIYIAQISYVLGRYENAAKAVALAISAGEGQKLGPPMPHWLDLGANAYWHAGNYEAAFFMLHKKLDLWPETASQTCGKLAAIASAIYSAGIAEAAAKVSEGIARCSNVTMAEDFTVLEISEPESPVWGERDKGEMYCTPMVLSTPKYPRSVGRKGVGGHVAARFDVDDDGWVKEESIELFESVPEGTFNEAAKDALLRFRFHLVAPGFDQTCRHRVTFLFRFLAPPK